MLPFLIVVIIALVTGEFPVFWLWTVKYASSYEAIKSMDIIILVFTNTFSAIWVNNSYLWLMAFAGVLVLIYSFFSKKQNGLTRIQMIFALLYFIFSALIVSSGFYFRAHYFIAILPAVALLAALFLESVITKIRSSIYPRGGQGVNRQSNVALIVLALIVAYNIIDNRLYYFNLAPKALCKMVYEGNPFNEAPEIAKYISAHSSDTDKIAVLGSEPEIYFYANRRAATGFLYTYSLVENQQFNEVMQKEMITQVEKSKPLYVVFCDFAYSWQTHPGVPTLIFDWMNKFDHDYYTPVGFADYFKQSGWHIYWEDDMKNRITPPESKMVVFKRNEK
jgi:hypothetical protein